MPEIQIDDAGTRLFYYDSGVPILADRPYTTLLIDIFNKLLEIAKASHIRLILLNRRGYHGSTAIPDSEMDYSSLADDSENSKLDFYTTFLKNRGSELATFLIKLIEKENIPPIVDTPGRASGGIGIMGWSLGNIITLSLLGLATSLDPVKVRKLDNYLRTVVIYDSPINTLGYSLPPTGYNPYYDKEIPESEREALFSIWVSSYYSHGSALMDPKTPISDLIDSMEQRNGNPEKPPTLTRLTLDDVTKCVEKITPGHGDLFVIDDKHRSINQQVHRKLLLNAVFGNDKEGPNAVMALPNTKVSYIWCNEAHWEIPYAARMLQAELDSPPSGYHIKRPVKFIAVEGANHYAQYDDPLKALANFGKAMEF
ncbi:hypothetical protein Clacol_006920 [Clathrus columnatus]|uniref:AB hydrolase-1 domain-containing protein n=1 Tax=Clathrus columnatus TaxID=1419009 RepID=A0AAV5ADG3_9AGAM|nr:hypothetical protein Clacol_006920 [Clathrus columnatus]